MALTLGSSAFENNGTIPSEYTCDGDRELSPPLSISGAPEGTKSFVLIMDDPDIPQIAKDKHGIEVFDHWVLYNIPADTTEIPEGSPVGQSGLTTRGAPNYTGPCPPRFARSEPTMQIQVGSCTHEPPPPLYEPREHRYIFYLYALSGTLDFSAPPTAAQVREALAPMLLAETKLVGRYARA